MLKLFEFLLYGHMHKWDIIEKRNVLGETWTGEKGIIGTRYTCQCAACGRIKNFGE